MREHFKTLLLLALLIGVLAASIFTVSRGFQEWEKKPRQFEPVISQPEDPNVITGIAIVTDGDTLRIGDAKIRLHGIDAPEKTQPCLHENGTVWKCGTAATEALRAKIANEAVRCEKRDVDRYKRIIAVCSVNGEDLNGWAVKQGYALAYTRYSRDYVDEENTALVAKRGIWRGKYTPPWRWRVEQQCKDGRVFCDPTEQRCSCFRESENDR